MSSADPPLQNPIRAELLERATDYALEAGIAGLSLRPLAAALGTSPRMLVYHFGSRDVLVRDILQAIRDRQRRHFEDSLTRGGGALPSATEALRRHWRWITHSAQRQYVRAIAEVHGLALRDPEQYLPILADWTRDWLDFLTERGRVHGIPWRLDRARATLLIDTLRGLSLDLLSTGDRRRVNSAFEHVVTMVASWKLDAGTPEAR